MIKQLFKNKRPILGLSLKKNTKAIFGPFWHLGKLCFCKSNLENYFCQIYNSKKIICLHINKYNIITQSLILISIIQSFDYYYILKKYL